MTSSEKESLIVNRDPKLKEYGKHEDQSKFISSMKHTVVLSVVTTMFNCSIQISAMTINQYVYKWLSDNLDNATLPNNASAVCNTNGTAYESDVQKQASKWLWYLTMVQYGLPIIFILTLGIYSDFMGRKPIMLISLFGNALMNVALAVVIFLNIDIAYFLAAFSIGGLAGARYSFHIGYLASVADTTGRNKDRSFKIVILDILMALGFGSGEIITGYGIKYAGYMYPIIISCGLSFVGACLVFIFIPETHKPRNDLKFSVKSGFNNLTGFYRNSDTLRGNKTWLFMLILLSFTIFFASMVSRVNIETLFMLRSPFCFTSDLIGWFQFAKQSVHSILGMFLVKLFHRCMNDVSIAFIGCVTGIAYYVIIAFSKTEWMLYVAIAAGILSSVPLPMYKAMTSQMVDDEKQGALFCNIVILQIICRLGGTSAFNNIYAHTQNIMPGLTFLVMAGFYLVAAVLLIPTFICRKKDTVTTFTIQ